MPTQFYSDPSHSGNIDVVVSPTEELNEPDLLLYWSVYPPLGDSLPSSARFVGPFIAAKPFVLPLDVDRSGYRFVRKVVVLLGFIGIVAALALVTGQMPFAKSAFEYGKMRSFEGIIDARPYPALLVARPGEVGSGEKHSRYLLVAPGKHGADSLVAAFDGKQVRLQGQLIYREDGTMIEIEPGSISPLNSFPAPQVPTIDLGALTVTGEIVDSKCYLGVMNPGNGKVHRDCAARCMSGGIPPVFVSLDGEHQYLLVGPDGNAIAANALREFVAEPITITGEALRRGESRLLRVDLRKLHHVSKRVEALEATDAKSANERRSCCLLP
jgi:hypothetical protein